MATTTAMTSNNSSIPSIFEPNPNWTEEELAQVKELEKQVAEVQGGSGDKPRAEHYEGIILSTYELFWSTGQKVTNYDDLKNRRDVRIKERGAKIGTKPVFLKDLRLVPGNGDEEYYATYVPVEEAARKLNEDAKDKTLLFCFHGNIIEAGHWMYEVQEAEFDREGSKHYAVPVVWPLFSGGILPPNYIYGDNRNDHAPASGQTLASFVECIPNDLFPRKSLMMHSMGAHLVLNWACRDGTPDVEFDNLFFVAADVPYDVFQKNPFESYFNQNQKKHFGNKRVKTTNLFGMLATDQEGKPRGKIVVLYSHYDAALQLSNILNGDHNRLGKVGYAGFKHNGNWADGNEEPYQDETRVRDEFKDFMDGRLCNDVSKTTDLGHGYQFKTEVLCIYDEYHIEQTN